MNKIVFIGAANPETIRMISAIRRAGDEFLAFGFIDNDKSKWGKTFYDLPVFGGTQCVPDLIDKNVRFVNLITGDLIARFQLSREIVRLGGQLANFIHPNVDQTMTTIGVGNYIQESVVLQAEVFMGNNSSIHMGSLIGHESRIGHSVFIAHGVSISGSCTIGDGSFIGTNATILPRISIGAWCVIGAGAVITKNIPSHSIVVGNPGKIIRRNDVSFDHGDVFQ